MEGGEAFILGISQHSHLFRAGWLRNVQAEQFQGSPSPSESCSGWGGGAGGTRAVVGPVIGVRGGIGGGAENDVRKLKPFNTLFITIIHYHLLTEGIFDRKTIQQDRRLSFKHVNTGMESTLKSHQ